MSRYNKRRRWPFWLAGFVVLCAALFFGANAVATSFCESQLAQRVKTATGASSASSSVGPFPALGHLLAEGEVPRVSVTVTNLALPVTGALRARVPDIPVQFARITLGNVAISRSSLVDHREIRVTAVGSAAVSLTLTATGLSAAAGFPVTIASNGAVQITADGVSRTGALRIEGEDTLVLLAGSTPVASVALRKGNLLPACRMSVVYAPGRATASCSISPVPKSLIAAVAANGVVARS